MANRDEKIAFFLLHPHFLIVNVAPSKDSNEIDFFLFSFQIHLK